MHTQIQNYRVAPPNERREKKMERINTQSHTRMYAVEFGPSRKNTENHAIYQGVEIHENAHRITHRINYTCNNKLEFPKRHFTTQLKRKREQARKKRAHTILFVRRYRLHGLYVEFLAKKKKKQPSVKLMFGSPFRLHSAKRIFCGSDCDTYNLWLCPFKFIRAAGFVLTTIHSGSFNSLVVDKWETLKSFALETLRKNMGNSRQESAIAPPMECCDFFGALNWFIMLRASEVDAGTTILIDIFTLLCCLFFFFV